MLNAYAQGSQAGAPSREERSGRCHVDKYTYLSTLDNQYKINPWTKKLLPASNRSSDNTSAFALAWLAPATLAKVRWSTAPACANPVRVTNGPEKWPKRP